MAQKDESQPGGLLSRVVRFVKNPATTWGEDQADTDRESSYSKQMLKEMIERKRRNDFVRKREFDMPTRHRDVLAAAAANQLTITKHPHGCLMAPIEAPRIIVGVMIDEPSDGNYFGGVAAAPVFSEVVQQTLRM